MRRIVTALAFGAACAGVCLPAQAAEGGSIASKIEELGKMEYLKVTDMRAVRRDNLLRIQFTVTNSSPKNEQLHYRFRWLDTDGFTVWEETPWKPEIVYGKQNKIINAVAPTFKATDFKLELQSPRNSTVSERTNPADNPPYH